jgi:hypothetical protein
VTAFQTANRPNACDEPSKAESETNGAALAVTQGIENK